MLTRNLTALLMRVAVDRHATLKADSHPAKWPTRLAGYRSPKQRCAGNHYGRRDRTIFGNGHRGPVYKESDHLRHGLPPSQISLIDRAGSESPTCDSLTGPPKA